ncbi:MAG: hypothetical protein GYA87_04975 [Christensenellaceae bacterium]|nr:hypothetical protein [Christensenellaceae bacterium]
MPINILEDIKKQEELAQAKVQQARQEAREMIKGVEAAVVEQERNALVDNRAMLQEKLESVKKDFKATMEEVYEKNKKIVDDEINSFRQNIPNVAEYIVERVMQHGNS